MIEQKFINAFYKQVEPELFRLHPDLTWEQKEYANNQGGDYCLFWTITRSEDNSIDWFSFMIVELDVDNQLGQFELKDKELGFTVDVIATAYGFGICGDSELRHINFNDNGYMFYPKLDVLSQVLKDMHDINLKITEELES